MQSKQVDWMLRALLLGVITVATAATGSATPDFGRRPTRHLSPSPTPEPASLVLLGTGLLFLSREVYKKKKTNQNVSR